jgi:type II secretory pathway component PulM
VLADEEVWLLVLLPEQATRGRAINITAKRRAIDFFITFPFVAVFYFYFWQPPKAKHNGVERYFSAVFEAFKKRGRYC